MISSRFNCNWFFILSIAISSYFTEAFITRTQSSFATPNRNRIKTDTFKVYSATLPSVGNVETEERTVTELDGAKKPGKIDVDVKFSHVHLYTDKLEDISVYKDLESTLNSFVSGHDLDDMHLNMPYYKKSWQALDNNQDKNGDGDVDISASEEFVPQNRDIVKQLLAGLGFRITATAQTKGTSHMVVTTKDQSGVQFVISAQDNADGDSDEEGEGEMNTDDDQDYDHSRGSFHHLGSNQIQQFYDEHNGRQGISVLAFEVTDGDIDSLFRRYQAFHPKLLSDDCVNANGAIAYEDETNGSVTKILEVFSYYKNEKGGEVDYGTKLRFVQREDVPLEAPILPGFKNVEAAFDDTCMPAYCDHWVSNVISRTGFLDTLEETLGFSPKVDFNAGVVAAGEAQIESTVTGNDSTFETTKKQEALVDQSQVYLPINNALNPYSHVHGFLEEVGQGIQHVASRVDDLPQFIQRGNDFREITGEGFTFLKIPRSYYGVLTVELLKENAGLSQESAKSILKYCESEGINDMAGAVDLRLVRDDLFRRLDAAIEDDESRAEFKANEGKIVETILQSRYINMYNLLGDTLSEERYLSIVRNQILVDVQGRDILYQIFTSNILQRRPGDESPFLEFIQRVCADCNDDGCPLGMKAGELNIEYFLFIE